MNSIYIAFTNTSFKNHHVREWKKGKKNIVPISCVYVDNSMLGKTDNKYVKKPIIIYFEQMLSTVDVTSKTPDGHKLEWAIAFDQIIKTFLSY